MDALSQRELSVLRDRVARVRLEREAQRAEEDRVVVRDPAPERGGATRYETEEERVEARRRTFRESARRLYSVCPRCGGRKAAHSAVKVCRRCYLAAVEPAHGTISRYASRTYACRCGLCRSAASDYHRAQRARLTEWKKEAA